MHLSIKPEDHYIKVLECLLEKFFEGYFPTTNYTTISKSPVMLKLDKINNSYFDSYILFDMLSSKITLNVRFDSSMININITDKNPPYFKQLKNLKYLREFISEDHFLFHNRRWKPFKIHLRLSYKNKKDLNRILNPIKLYIQEKEYFDELRLLNNIFHQFHPNSFFTKIPIEKFQLLKELKPLNKEQRKIFLDYFIMFLNNKFNKDFKFQINPIGFLVSYYLRIGIGSIPIFCAYLSEIEIYKYIYFPAFEYFLAFIHKLKLNEQILALIQKEIFYESV